MRPGSSGTLGQPSNLGHGQGPVPTFQVVQSQNPQGKPFIRPSSTGQNYCASDSHGGVLGREPLHHPGNIEQLPPCPVGSVKCPSQKAGYFEGSIHPYGTTERGPFVPAGPGVPGAVEPGSPSAHGSISAPYVRDERFKPFPQENLKPFSGPNDKHPYGSGRDSGLRTEPGIDPGFSKILPLSHQAAGFRNDKSRKNNSGHLGRRFNRSRRDGLPPRSPAPFGRSIRDGRFPVSSNSLSSVDLDVPGCLHKGNHLQRSERISPHNLHLVQGKEPFDNPRKRKVGSIVGSNCEVDCDTVEGLDSHSQSRDH